MAEDKNFRSMLRLLGSEGNLHCFRKCLHLTDLIWFIENASLLVMFHTGIHMRRWHLCA